MSLGTSSVAFATEPSVSAASYAAPLVLDAAAAGRLVIPGEGVLIGADFARQGSDLLLTAPDGGEIIVRDYFTQPTRPDLWSDAGQVLRGDLVARLAGPLAPGQVAQTDAAAGTPIGHVTAIEGEAVATRVDGSRAPLAVDAPIYQGDVLETAGGASLNVIFVDNTSFALGENARMVIDELVYDPSSGQGSAAFSMVEGLFVFVSGEVAHSGTDAMTLSTPVATIGIRGTGLAILAAPEGLRNLISLLTDPTGKLGSVVVSNDGGTITLDEANETTAVTSHDAGPSITFLLSPQQVRSLFGTPLGLSPFLGTVPEPTGGDEGRESDESGKDTEGHDTSQVIKVVLANESGDPFSEFDVAFDQSLLTDGNPLVDILNKLYTPPLEGEENLQDQTDSDHDEEIIVVVEGGGARRGGLGTDGDDVIDATVLGRADQANLLVGFGGNDVITGGNLTDFVFGGDGNDTVSGGAGNDFIDAGAGNDLIIGGSGLGDDGLFGGDGIDTVTYASTSTGVFANLASGFAIGGEIGQDFLASIENLIGGAGNDSFFGNGDDNSLYGAAGDDFLAGGAGNDELDGGDGNDTASFQDALSGVNVDLGAGTATGDGDDVLTDIENVLGSNVDDTITGDTNANVLNGGSGNDHLDGGSGDDILDGGSGNDIVDGGAGVDTLLVDFDFFATSTVDLANSTQSDFRGTDTLTSIENVDGSGSSGFLSIIGSNGDNVLKGGEAGDAILGGLGDDQIFGNGGNDVLDGGGGNDALDGGAGSDTVTYAQNGNGVVVDLANGSGTGGSVDTYVSIENVTGSDHDDSIFGDAGSNVLLGGLGNDVLDGGAGPDNLAAGDGDDRVFGNDDGAFDFFDGGIGLDILDFSGSSANLNINVGGQFAVGNGGDTIVGFEHVIGGSGNDVMVGTNVFDVLLDGGAGNDTIFGLNTNDSLFGGSGDDRLSGGFGNDFVNGQGGTDTFVITDNQSVFVDLGAGTSTGGLGDDALFSIENVDGTNGNQITVTGSGGANVIIGSQFGDDSLSGVGGADSIFGGGGNDLIFGGAADDSLDGGLGNDVLDGGGGNDSLFGNDGNDLLDGGAGDDSIDGGNDFDTLTFASSGGPIVATLDDFGGGVATGVGTDHFSNIERVVGSDFDDSITGGNGDDRLAGGLGDDILNGGGGNDILDFSDATVDLVIDVGTGTAGGEGSDTFSNFESIVGGSGNDIIDGGNADDALFGGDGSDVLDGGLGNDILVGGNGNNVINGDANDFAVYLDELAGIAVSFVDDLQVDHGAFADDLVGFDNVTGTNFDDTFEGGVAVEIFFGADGDDTFFGSAGDDSYDGGNGNDTLNYSSASGSVSVDLLSNTTSGAFGNDSIFGIENVIGSFDDDTITGDGLDNILDGGGGNDDIDGGDGDDILLSGGGDDQLEGGAGNDTVDFSTAGAGISIDMDDNTAQITALGTITFVDDFENLTGTTGNDVIQGNALDNVIDGGGGTVNDVIFGNGGDDTIIGSDAAGGNSFSGGNGDDRIFGGTGDDQIDGDANDDFITAGAGDDSVSGGTGDDDLSGEGGDDIVDGSGDGAGSQDALRGGLGNDTLIGDGNDFAIYGELGATTLDLALGTANHDGFTDTLTGIRNAIGSEFNDTLSGNGAANVLIGLGGGDVLFGLNGNDTLIGGDDVDQLVGGAGNDALFGDNGNDSLHGDAGNDQIDGGAGSDLADYSAGAAIVADIGAGTVTGQGNDTLISVERIIGSNNNDTFLGGGSGNVLEGALGIDTFSMANSTIGTTINLSAGFRSDGFGFDTLTGFEVAVGSDFNDTFVGSNVQGDVLRGGLGNDFFDALLGDDVINGGGGIDVASFGSISAAVNVNLANSTATGQGTDTLIGIENVDGSDQGDILRGNAGNNVLRGFNGADSLFGAGGDDRLEGGSAPFGLLDILDGGAGNDTFVGTGLFTAIVQFGGASSGVTVDLSIAGPQAVGGGLGSDTFQGIRILEGTGFGDTFTAGADGSRLLGEGGADVLNGGIGGDSLFGGAGNDQLFGNGGNDNLFADGGNDLIDGGDGLDTLDFTGSDFGVTVDLGIAGPQNFGVGLGNDTVTGVEQVVGSGLADQLTGGDGNDLLSGGGDVDVLSGGGGDDFLNGGDGNDNLAGGAGNDALDGGIGDDQMNGGAGDDVFAHSAGVDQIDGGDGADRMDVFGFQGVTANLGQGTVTIGSETDTVTRLENLTGSFVADSITGSADRNELNGLAGDDVLNGAAGDDFLTGGQGNDALNGGTGLDVASYEGASQRIFVDLGQSVQSQTGGNGTDTYTSIEGVIAGNNRDILIGNDADNYIEGGGEIDIITGGLGADTFGYQSPLLGTNLVATNTPRASTGDGVFGDIIFDFLTGVDKILVDATAFGGIAVGTLTAANFVTIAGAYNGINAPVAAGTPTFIFSQEDNTLYFDFDTSVEGYSVIADVVDGTVKASDIQVANFA